MDPLNQKRTQPSQAVTQNKECRCGYGKDTDCGRHAVRLQEMGLQSGGLGGRAAADAVGKLICFKDSTIRSSLVALFDGVPGVDWPVKEPEELWEEAWALDASEGQAAPLMSDAAAVWEGDWSVKSLGASLRAGEGMVRGNGPSSLLLWNDQNCKKTLRILSSCL